MIRRIVKIAALLGALAGLTLGSLALAQGGSGHKASSESSGESTAPENSNADPDNVQYTAPGDANYHGAKAAAHARGHHSAKAHHSSGRHHSNGSRPAQGSNDPSGTTASTGTAGPTGTTDPSGSTGEQASGVEQESNVEAEQGQPGEPANGHADQPGQNVAHECTGNCVE
jgi:hypothetical protein